MLCVWAVNNWARKLFGRSCKGRDGLGSCCTQSEIRHYFKFATQDRFALCFCFVWSWGKKECRVLVKT